MHLSRATFQPLDRKGAEDVLLSEVIPRLGASLNSRLGSHEGNCCRSARLWFRARARAEAAMFSGPPVWLRARWRWGPRTWPLHWCEVMHGTSADCGAFACLAAEALGHIGISAWPVQVIEQFNDSAAAAWRHSWDECTGRTSWVFRSLVYHEVVAVSQAGGPTQECCSGAGSGAETPVRLWDPTDSCWVELRPPGSYAGHLAVRVCPGSEGTPAPGPVSLRRFAWGRLRLLEGTWVLLPERDGGVVEADGSPPDPRADHVAIVPPVAMARR